MGDELVERAVRVKDDAVGARRGAGVDGVAGQDGELVPGGGGGEGDYPTMSANNFLFGK